MMLVALLLLLPAVEFLSELATHVVPMPPCTYRKIRLPKNYGSGIEKLDLISLALLRADEDSTLTLRTISASCRAFAPTSE